MANIQMKAETAKFGSPNFFRLNIVTDKKGQIQVTTDVNGFNPYELVGLLEVVKQNIQQSIK